MLETSRKMVSTEQLGVGNWGLQALAFMGDDFMFQLFGKYRDMANAVKNPCHLNLAACLLKLNRFEEVIGHCTVVRMPLSAFQNNLGHSLCANLLIFVVSIWVTMRSCCLFGVSYLEQHQPLINEEPVAEVSETNFILEHHPWRESWKLAYCPPTFYAILHSMLDWLVRLVYLNQRQMCEVLFYEWLAAQAESIFLQAHASTRWSFICIATIFECGEHGCIQVLAEDQDNSKALFRRGKARLELGQTDTAKLDFEKVRKLAPEDKAAIRELRVIAQQEREVYLKQKEMYKGLFKAPELPAKTPTTHWYTSLWNFLCSIFYFFFRFQRPKKD